MSVPDTVSGAPVPDRQRPVDGLGEPPDPTAATVSLPGAYTPGPVWTERGPTSASTDKVAASATPIPGPLFPTIPGYRVLGVLGRGGMGTVYHALDVDLGREVALKLISPGGRDESAVRGRFEREVHALARIEHPNIVPIYDAGEWEGFFPYFTMKLVPGGPLSRHLDRFRGDVRASVRLVAKVARAVGALHAAGVLHRDLKPLNILLGDHDEPLVADFGLARWVGDDSGPTESGSPVGTRAYMSPEQSLGSKTDYTPACDVWAIGVVLFEVLTGRRPFASEDPVELYLKIRSEPAPPASGFNPDVPAGLDAVIGRCVAERPENRYQSAVAVAEDLERWLAGVRVEAAAAPAGAPTTPSRRRRSRTHRLVVLGLLVFASTAVGVLAVRQGRAPLTTPSPE